jgi:hypothetical protein
VPVLPAGVPGVSETDEGGDSFDSIGVEVYGGREGEKDFVCVYKSKSIGHVM